jgi:transcriptional regulator with XRE-family HTH domain
LNYILDNEANNFLDIVSANVIRIRKLKGYSQLRLATEMGYSSASYFGRAEIRKNNEHFNLVQLFKISRILNVPLSDFFISTNEITIN